MCRFTTHVLVSLWICCILRDWGLGEGYPLRRDRFLKETAMSTCEFSQTFLLVFIRYYMCVGREMVVGDHHHPGGVSFCAGEGGLGGGMGMGYDEVLPLFWGFMDSLSRLFYSTLVT